MDESKEKLTERRNGFTKIILKENYITVLDLSHRNLNSFNDIEFPSNLFELNLSNNNFKEVPPQILTLSSIKVLNLYNNRIKLFDEVPAFCHTIEVLNLADNELLRPPYWVWAECPKNLRELDITCNINIRKLLTSDYLMELLQYKTRIRVIKMCNCYFSEHLELLGTFASAKILDLSSQSTINANSIYQVPCRGLDECCDIQRLYLSHTNITTVNTNIDIYNNLIEINLSENNITSLPKEFCNLKNLEICILSFNLIMCLPDDIVKLKKLTALCLDNNRLCMLPERMLELNNLMKLDVYDNCLYDIPEDLDYVQELDLAQNYFDEPEDGKYKEKKEQLRTALELPKDCCRHDGRKLESDRPESSYSSRTIDEELSEIAYDSNSPREINDRPLSSPEEDWDSDDYWVPHFPRFGSALHPKSPWIFYVKKIMSEGNFCPIDAHAVPVVEKVRYERLCHPKIEHEVEGQFDDYSSDES